MSAANMKQERKKLAGDGNDQEGNDETGRGEQVEKPMIKEQKKQRKKGLAEEAKAATPKSVVKNRLEKHKTSPSDWKEVEVGTEDDEEAEEIQLDGFSFSAHLTTSSPPSQSNLIETVKSSPTISSEQRAIQRARLAARIEALRAKRRADSPDGTPARNRHELMIARRREEAVQRKERKKEVRLHQKATIEQTKTTTLPAVKFPVLEKSKIGDQSQLSEGKGPKKPLLDRSEGGGKAKMSKKSNSKKSRPGFEGSLKSSKRGKK